KVGRQRQKEVGKRKDRGGNHQQPSRTEYHAEPSRYRPDQHLADREGGRDPGAFIEAGVNSAADVGEPENRNAAVQGRDDGAQQHGEHADQRAGREDGGLWRGPVARMSERPGQSIGIRTRFEMQSAASDLLHRAHRPTYRTSARESGVEVVSMVAITDIP